MPDQRDEALKMAKDALDKALDEAKRNRSFIQSIGPAIVETLRPVLDKIASNSRMAGDELRDAISKIKIDINPEVKIPEIRIPDIKIPPIKVPRAEVNVKIPEIKIPKFDFPKQEQWPRQMSVSLPEITSRAPLPVILTDDKGNPYIAGSFGSSSGPKVIQDILTAGGQSISDEVNRAIRVNVATGSVSLSGNDTNIGPSGANTLRMTIATDSVSSINVFQYAGNSVATGTEDSGGVIRVYQVQNVSNSVDVRSYGGTNVAVGTEDGAGVMRVYQVQNSSNSVDVRSLAGNSVATDQGVSNSGTLRVVHAVDVGMSTNIIGGSIANTGFNITGQDENSGPVSANTLRVVHAVDVGTSTNIIADYHDTNQGDTGANTLRIIHAGDLGLSAKAIAVAMTTNPTAASDASDTYIRADKLGRALVIPVQVRQLRSTAYATLNSNAETTIIASPASTFLDLCYIAFANTSTATVNLDLRSETGAGIVNTYAVPANATQGFSTPVPWPQNTLAATWTIKFNGSDISNTTVYVNALFTQEI